MKQFCVFFFQCRCKCRSRICPISNLIHSFYLTYFLYIWKKSKNLKIPVSFLSFVDNGLFISQEKSFDKMNTHLFCSYNVISSLLEQFGLIIKYGKTEVFHFSRSHGLLDPLPLNLSHIEVLSFSLRIPRSILDLFLLESYHFINTSNIMPIKLYLWSSAWRC